MLVGSLIISISPNWQVISSILEPLYVVMPLLYQGLDFTLKSSRMIVRKGLFTITESRLDSGLLRNDSKSSWHWLGQRYNETKPES